MKKYRPSICQESNRLTRPSLVAEGESLPNVHLMPEQVYLASDVDARITEMRQAFETSSTDEESKLRSRVAELEKALSRYADHDPFCDLEDPCSCGLEAALKSGL